jgi:hypothetical protein
LAIPGLIDAYGHCADRRDADGQEALFTEDTHFVVYMNGEGTAPTDDLHGREVAGPPQRARREHGARIVPAYGPKEVCAQANGAKAEGISEWILWDPIVTYTPASCLTA